MDPTHSPHSAATRPTPDTGLAALLLTAGADGAGLAEVDLRPGQRLGDFELIRLLGRGGMGQVFLAEQLQPMQRQVALKFMQLRVVDDAAAVRFEIERQALARMSHPAIAQVHEAGTTADGFPYLAMEYVPGEPVDDWCRRRAVPLAERLRLFLKIALGVQHAHRRGILHLDLKPDNLLVGEVDGIAQPKIIDFGLATSAVRVPGQKRAVMLAGTRGYMSPEQAGIDLDGDTRPEVDARSDVHALGVVLYELVAGAPPFRPGQFSDADSDALRRAWVDWRPDPASARLRAAGRQAEARRVAGDLDAVILRAMQPRPAERYESVSELIAELERFLDHRPVRARPAGTLHRIALSLRRHRGVAVTLATLLLTLAVGLGVASWGLMQAQAERDRVAERKRELERVIDFQQGILAGADPARMGEVLRQSLLEQHAAGLAQDPEREAKQAGFAEALAQANPTEAARQLLSAELLARADAALDRDFADQPAIAAELRSSLAQTQAAIGQLPQALTLAQRALADLERQPGSTTAALELRLARAEWATELGEGRAQLGALPELIRAATAAGAEALTLRAELLRLKIEGQEAGRLAASIAAVRELLPRIEARHGVDDDLTIRAMQLLGRLEQINGELPAAIGRWREVQRRLEARHGEADLRHLAALEQLGNALGLGGDIAQALPLHQRALALRRELQGAGHPDTLTAMNLLAVTLWRDRQRPAAIELTRQVHALRQQTLGPDHPGTLRSALNLGAFLATEGDLAGATELTRDVYQRRLRQLGPDNPDTWTAAANLVDFEIILGRPADALTLARAVYANRRRLLGEAHRDTDNARAPLARALVAAGGRAHWQEAEALLTAELAVPVADRSAATRAMTAWHLSRALTGLGRRVEAARWSAEARALLTLPIEAMNPPQRHARHQLATAAHRTE